MSRIHVVLLGGLRIERDGREIRDLPAQPVRCALFLYLALEVVTTFDRGAPAFPRPAAPPYTQTIRVKVQ